MGVLVVSHSTRAAAGLPHHSHLLEQNHNELSIDFPAASGTRKYRVTEGSLLGFPVRGDMALTLLTELEVTPLN